MPADPESEPRSEQDRLEAATDEAIAACGGDALDAVKALIVANEFWKRKWKNCGPMFRKDTATTTEDLRPIPVDRSEDHGRVTYYVALPFVATDDGVAAGEPTECLYPVAVVLLAEAPSGSGLL